MNEALRCGCLEGFLTNEEHHESWCPAITGDYSGLPELTFPIEADTIQQQPDEEEEA